VRATTSTLSQATVVQIASDTNCRSIAAMRRLGGATLDHAGPVSSAHASRKSATQGTPVMRWTIKATRCAVTTGDVLKITRGRYFFTNLLTDPWVVSPAW